MWRRSDLVLFARIVHFRLAGDGWIVPIAVAMLPAWYFVSGVFAPGVAESCGWPVDFAFVLIPVICVGLLAAWQWRAQRRLSAELTVAAVTSRPLWVWVRALRMLPPASAAVRRRARWLAWILSASRDQEAHVPFDELSGTVMRSRRAWWPVAAELALMSMLLVNQNRLGEWIASVVRPSAERTYLREAQIASMPLADSRDRVSFVRSPAGYVDVEAHGDQQGALRLLFDTDPRTWRIVQVDVTDGNAWLAPAGSARWGSRVELTLYGAAVRMQYQFAPTEFQSTLQFSIRRRDAADDQPLETGGIVLLKNPPER